MLSVYLFCLFFCVFCLFSSTGKPVQPTATARDKWEEFDKSLSDEPVAFPELRDEIEQLEAIASKDEPTTEAIEARKAEIAEVQKEDSDRLELDQIKRIPRDKRRALATKLGIPTPKKLNSLQLSEALYLRGLTESQLTA